MIIKQDYSSRIPKSCIIRGITFPSQWLPLVGLSASLASQASQANLFVFPSLGTKCGLTNTYFARKGVHTGIHTDGIPKGCKDSNSSTESFLTIEFTSLYCQANRDLVTFKWNHISHLLSCFNCYLCLLCCYTLIVVLFFPTK